MAYKLTLIEYDQDIFDGDDMSPDISYRDYVRGVQGSNRITEEEQAEVDLTEAQQRIEDMRVYARVISSSSSSSSSSSFSSSSSSSSSESPYKSVYIASDVKGITFSPDGTKFYCVVDEGTYDYIYQYSLSTAWDIDTLSYVDKKNVTGYDLLAYGARGLAFKDDGSMVYVGGYYEGNGFVQGHPLNTAWDITSFQSDTQFLWVTGYPRSIRFEENGEYMYVLSLTLASPYSAVLEYTLTSPWYINGASQYQMTSMESYDTDCYGICFHGDGGTMLVMGNNTGIIYYWTLPTAWRLIGESKTDEFDVDDLIGGSQRDIFCNPDGDKIFVMGGDGYLYEFDVS